MKIIGLFSIQRTGTNYLHSVLRQWPALVSFDEVFHPTRVFGLKRAQLRALSNQAGIDFHTSQKNAVGPEFTRWARANPLDVIDTLSRVVARKDRAALMFKVFMNQWTVPPENIIVSLARRSDFTPIILQRRCIDAYISLQKAEAAGRFKALDTTDAPVALDPAAYEHWANKARDWYRLLDTTFACIGKTPLRLRYEEDVDMPPGALSVHWGSLLGLAQAGAIDADITVQRQDRTESRQAKIANYDEFTAALIERGLMQEALGYFLDPPL
jgi:hypothetical protein